MFTGIVEELGIIRKLHVSGHSGSIEIEAHKVLRNTNVGDSIAVNGICLTVTSLGKIFLLQTLWQKQSAEAALKMPHPGTLLILNGQWQRTADSVVI